MTPEVRSILEELAQLEALERSGHRLTPSERFRLREYRAFAEHLETQKTGGVEVEP